MKALTFLTLAVLVLTPSGSRGQDVYADQLDRPARGSEDVTPNNLLGFPGEDYFNANDSSCVIIESGSLVLEQCHENVDKPIPITFRETWDLAMEAEAVDLPVDLVVIKGGGANCDSKVKCMSQIQSMRKRAQNKACDLRENFYVGGDGNVYEGRGWGLASYWHLNGLRKKSITVQFLGPHDRKPPSPDAMEAFETAMEIGLWLGKLSKTYKVTSIQQLYRNITVYEDHLTLNLSQSDRWWSGEEISTLWEYTEPGRLSFVFRRQWNASKPTKEFGSISQTVDHVVISEGGDRCLSRADCSSKMGKVQAECIEHYGDVLENFYIGDKGEIYEGRGWSSPPHWYVKGLTNRFISVRFFGSFANELPSRKAINSLKLLVQTGVWLKKISPDHRMISLRQIYNQSVLLGDPLHEYVRRWSIWSEDNVFNLPRTASLRPFVSRSEWNARSHIASFSSTKTPIKYIMIGDGGIRCFSIEQCSSKMRSEQDLNLEIRGDLLDNFYVGDDGIIYEGRGWDVLPYLHTPFFNRSLITVKFMGSFQSILPSQPGWLAFLALLDAGIASGKISPDYKMYSFRHIYNDSSLLGDKISQLFEEMRPWDGLLSLASEDQRASSGILPMYQLERSTSHGMPHELPLSLPVDYVVVGDTGERCFTLEDCRENLRMRQSGETRLFGGLTYNFYVGEDGSVFAGRGWNSTSYWHVKGVKANTLFVSFSGRFQNVLPSPYAILAFNRLLKFGVETGKVATDHKIISVRQLFPSSTHAGDMLAERIKSSRSWSEYEALSPGGTSIPFGPSAFVSKTQWSARGVIEPNSETLSYPISLMIVLDADASCVNLEDCILRVQAEQRRVHPKYGDAMENFYVGEDGRIYEGRGWSQKTQWHSRIFTLDYDFATVAFLGKFQTQLPSSKAYTAFEYWIKEGIMTGKLAANCSFVSMRQFIPSGQVPGEALDKNIRTWENWLNDTSATFVTDNFKIFSPHEWGRSLVIRRSNKIIHPLKYVFIREGGLPCSTQNDCITRMKSAEKEKDAITENFYIGGTGATFEGVGWEYDTKWGYTGWKYSISVYFMGTFGSGLPTHQALGAFDILCQDGVRRGYLASDYKILFIPDNYNSKIWVGAKFKELIKSWKRWIQNAV